MFGRLQAALVKLGFKGALIYGGEDVGPGPLRADNDTEIVLATVCCTQGLTAKGQEWVRKYVESTREAPGYPAFQAADAIRLLLEAMQEGNAAGPLHLRERLQKLDSFESQMGPITFKDHRTAPPCFSAAAQRPRNQPPADDRSANRMTTGPDYSLGQKAAIKKETENPPGSGLLGGIPWLC